MPDLSRRSVLASFALTGAAAISRPALAAGSSVRKADADALLAYFSANGPHLLREASGIFRHPGISPTLPGKQYSNQLWDWDTLWTARGLFRLAQLTNDRDFERRLCDHARGSLFNFLDHQGPSGRIPIMLSATNPDVLGTLAPAPTPNSHNQAKPVFGQMALLVADQSREVAWLAPRFDALLHFYASWFANNRTPPGLLVWGNDVAIGNDNDPTTFGRPAFSSANLLLNCLFYQDLRASSELARRLNRTADHDRLAGEARALGDSIQKQCWDPRDRFFYTADVQCVDRRTELIPGIARGMAMSWGTVPLRIQTFTGFLPLWCGLATPAQASALIHAHYLADDRFRSAAGVRSLSNRESMYSLDFSSNPINWLGPVWLIADYLVWCGLRDYGFTAETDELAGKTTRLLAHDLAVSGSLNEYYHPDTSEALSHKGFMDWNLLALEMI